MTEEGRTEGSVKAVARTMEIDQERRYEARKNRANLVIDSLVNRSLVGLEKVQKLDLRRM